MKPLIEKLRAPRCSFFFKVALLFTGQHEHIVDLNGLSIDHHITIQDSPTTTSRLNSLLGQILICDIPIHNYDYIVVQGDTTSALGMALYAFHHQKPIIYIESGLRTHNLRCPFPEELNRQLISRITYIHFCPTDRNRENLFMEGCGGDKYVVGNTSIDNIKHLRNSESQESKIVLITLHRRENLPHLAVYFYQIGKLCETYQDHEFIYPVHPNPEIATQVDLLRSYNNLKILVPLSHEDLLTYMLQSRVIITDSGGIQEEACYLRKRTIVCRAYTEREECIGLNATLCQVPDDLIDKFEDIKDKIVPDYVCPYGEGDTSDKIVDIILSKYA